MTKTYICSSISQDFLPSPSLPPSAWWIVEVWIVEYVDYQLFIHSVILIECVLTLICPSSHMTSIVLSILERDPPLFSPEGFLPFFPWRVVWEFFLIRCEVKGQGCLCVQIVNVWEWAIQMNWIELSVVEAPNLKHVIHVCTRTVYMKATRTSCSGVNGSRTADGNQNAHNTKNNPQTRLQICASYANICL